MPKLKRYVALCSHCIYATSNTIFHKSSTPLVLWYHIILLFNVSKNRISAKEIEHQLDTTYKTAWKMANRISNLLIEFHSLKLAGKIEIDESYIDGLELNKHQNKKLKQVLMINLY